MEQKYVIGKKIKQNGFKEKVMRLKHQKKENKWENKTKMQKGYLKLCAIQYAYVICYGTAHHVFTYAVLSPQYFILQIIV